MSAHLQGVVFLTLVTLLWGTTFAVVKDVVADFPPSLLVFLRFAIAAVFFLPFLRRGWGLWIAGLELGLWLVLGYGTQTLGLVYTTANRSAFITALSVILVPLFAGLGGRRIPGWVWGGAALALVGVGLLSFDGTPPNRGDAWTLLTALSYALYVLRLEHYAVRYPANSLTAAQIVSVVGWSLVWVGFERPSVEAVPWGAMIYLGAVVTALTTWLMVLGQGKVSAPEAAVIYTLEPAWASLFAFLLLGEVLGVRGWLGAGLIFAAMLVSQWGTLRSARAQEASGEAS